MNSDRWQRVRQIFEQASQLDADEREAFLVRECAGDEALRQEIEALLDAASEAATHDLDGNQRAASTEDGVDYAGLSIGPYRVVGQLGQGGMGLVLLAVRDDDEYKKQVAIKLIRSRFLSDELKRRFRQERQILATLEHPHIARLIDGGTTNRGEPYVVMEYVQGEPIDVFCQQQQLSTAERIRLFCTVSDAVHEAHRQLVVHRDLKPNNILVTRDGTPKLLDFGIAKLIGSPEGEHTVTAITAPGVRLLTPEYASPEQVRHGPITTASDTYSLGVLLYELLTGVRPFRFQNRLAREVERVICEEMPERPSTAVGSLAKGDSTGARDSQVRSTSKLRRELAGDLDNIVMMALRKEPQRRYRSAVDLADDLRRHLDGMPVSARSDTWVYRSSKFLRRHALAVTTALVFVVLLVAGVITLAVQSARISYQRDRAQDAEQEAKVEAETATQVADFLVGLFSRSTPDSVAAAEMTIRDVVDQGAERISQELSTQPAVQARLMDVLGRVYGQLQALDASEQMTNDAMNLRKQLYGADHPEIADSLMSMGALQYHRGDMEAAGSLYQQALDMRRELVGPDHPSIADAMEAVATVKRFKGQFPAAEQLRRDALAMLERMHGDRHPAVAKATHAVAVTIWAGAYRPAEESEAMYRKALARYQELYGDNHLATVDCMSDLAIMLKNRQAYDEAEPLYKQVVEVRKKVLGKDHTMYAQSLSNYATFLRRLDRYDEAEQLYQEAIEIYRTALGKDHRFLAGPLFNLAAVLSEQGQHEESLRIAREAEAVSMPKPGEKVWFTDLIRVQIGWSLFKLEQFDDAEQILRDAYEGLQASLGPQSAQCDKARERLLKFYDAREMPEQAAEFRAPDSDVE